MFRTVADPFIGKLSYVKVMAGKLSGESQLINMRTGEPERIGKTLVMRGKKQIDVPFIGAGDIGAVPKLQGAKTGDTLCSPARKVKLEGVDYPNPSLSMAVMPKNKGEEDKIAQGIVRLEEEDPTIRFRTNQETHQMILSGLGEQHLEVIAAKLKKKFGVEIVLEPAARRLPRDHPQERCRCRANIRSRPAGTASTATCGSSSSHATAKKWNSANASWAASVPKNFFPAVEKGLRESVEKGPLAGYPVVGLRATLYDGSYHPVDSSEMSFKMAANLAYKTGMPKAGPVLLEPIGLLKCTVPDSNMGDVMGEVNKRRGRVLGMDPAENGKQMIEAEVPEAEMHDFSTFVRQTTQGRGSFTFDFARYEEAPPQVSQKVMEEAEKTGRVSEG